MELGQNAKARAGGGGGGGGAAKRGLPKGGKRDRRKEEKVRNHWVSRATGVGA